MRTLHFTILTAILSHGILFGQVQIDKPIQLTGSGSDGRVTGIKQATDAEDATSASIIQNGQLVYSPATGTANDIGVALAPVPAAYTEGMMVSFKAQHDNTGPVNLHLNSLSPAPIKKYVSSDLSAGDIKSGQMVTVIFDGTNFQLISQPGTAPVTNTSNLDYTLDVNPSSTYTNAGYTTAHAPVTINATLISGFSPVSLSITGLPAGVTYSISPGGGFPSFSSVLIFTVGPAVAPGSYSLTLVGNGGIQQQTVPITLDVYPISRIFVSAGELPTTAGAAQRNALCNSEASSAGLPGTYKAWVSNAGNNNISATSGVTYRLVNDDLAAWDWADLTDGTIANPIHLTASSQNYTGTVYTGLNNNGTSSSNDCTNWTSSSGSVQSTVGNAGGTADWSNITTAPCGTPEVEVGETLNSNNCFACPGNMFFTTGTCGSNCGIYNLDSNCNLPGNITWGPFTYYNCMRAGEAINSRHYCVQE